MIMTTLILIMRLVFGTGAAAGACVVVVVVVVAAVGVGVVGESHCCFTFASKLPFSLRFVSVFENYLMPSTFVVGRFGSPADPLRQAQFAIHFSHDSIPRVL